MPKVVGNVFSFEDIKAAAILAVTTERKQINDQSDLLNKLSRDANTLKKRKHYEEESTSDDEKISTSDGVDEEKISASASIPERKIHMASFYISKVTSSKTKGKGLPRWRVCVRFPREGSSQRIFAIGT
jgi:hypothetical protein